MKLTYEDSEKYIKDFVKDFKHKIDCIVTPSRGGLFIAQRIAYLLDIETIYTLNIKSNKKGQSFFKDSFVNEILKEINENNKKVLIVDNIYDKGATIELLRKNINNSLVYTIFKRTEMKPYDYYSVNIIGSEEFVDFFWE